jgi:hypothetical protein
MFESGNRPEAAIMVPGVIELDLNSKPDARDAVNAHVELQRAA